MLYRCNALKGSDAEQTLDVFLARVTAVLEREAVAASVHYAYAGFDEETSRFVWEAVPTHESEVHVDDDAIEGRYLTVGAVDLNVCERVQAVLASEFSFWSVPELISKALACSNEDADWITRLAAVASGAPNSSVANVIQRRLDDPGREVRYAAALAATTVRWPELLPALIAAEAREVDPGVRQELVFVIGVLQRQADPAKSRPQ